MKASSRLFSGAAALLLVIMATGANCPSACKHRLTGFFFPPNYPNEIWNAVFVDPECSVASLIVVGSAKCDTGVEHKLSYSVQLKTSPTEQECTKGKTSGMGEESIKVQAGSPTATEPQAPCIARAIISDVIGTDCPVDELQIEATVIVDETPCKYTGPPAAGEVPCGSTQ